MKKFFIGVLVGALIFGGITAVSAYTLLANNIGYTPSDNTWKKSDGEDITNVKDAIDELYNEVNASREATQVATLTTRGATYTMQNDGYIIGTARQGNDSSMARLFLNEKMLALSNWDDNIYYDVSVYVTKGTVVTTRSDGGTYNLTIYEWK